MSAYRTILVSSFTALLSPLAALGQQDLSFALRAVLTPTATERVPSLPASTGGVAVGTTYYVELWISDVGTVNSGVTSAYVDMTFDDARVDVLTPIDHGTVFTAWQQGTVGSGLIDELGGSTFLGGVGVQPEWAKVATVRVQAAVAQRASFSLLAGSTGCAAYGRGLISPSNIDFGSVLNVAQIDLADISAGLEGVANASLAWGDYDNDDDLDLVIAGQAAGGRVSKIYRNMGGGTFAAIEAGLVGVSDCSLSWGDYDNDGDLDLALAGDSDAGAVTRIYRNDGNNTFADLGLGLTGVSHCSLAWADYDGDGRLDLAVAGQSASGPVSLIYRNAGTPATPAFTDIGAPLTGVRDCSLAWADYDNDGRPDLAIAGNDGTSPVTTIHRNEGNGVFTAISPGIPGVKDCSLAWGDYDNDGDFDLAIAGNDGSVPVSKVFRNSGNGVFADSGAALAGVERCSLAWGDFDGDGDLDLLITGMAAGGRVSKIYSNDGGVFNEANMNMDGVSDCAVAWADFDNDNDLDLALAGSSSTGPVSKVYRVSGSTANTKPLTPGGLSASQSGPDAMTFSWLPASDTQTAVPGLSYNLRIGTTPGGEDVMYAMAQVPSGFRRIPATGNVYKRLSFTIRGLSRGRYYASVQSVDTSFAGSLWSTEESASICSTSVRYVKADAPAGGDGCDWDTAYTSLQQALSEAAGSGGAITEIWVATGTYRPAGPDGDREATFQLINGVSTYGGFAGTETQQDDRDPSANVTILSGDLNGDDGPDFTNNSENSYHVVTGSGTDATAVLDGFAITGGNADGSSDDIFGGGVFNKIGHPTITACTIEANAAVYGAGMQNYQSSPTLSQCTFSGNKASAHGGGMYNWPGSSPTLSQCQFNANSAVGSGGAVANHQGSSPVLRDCVLSANSASGGGGMYNQQNSPTLIGCMFTANTADAVGGGVYNYGSSPQIVNCRLLGNVVTDGSGKGGGAYNDGGGTITFVNCEFAGNRGVYGGGMYNASTDSCHPILTNCTLAQNTAGNVGGGIYNAADISLVLANCILSDNTAAGVGGFASQLYNVNQPFSLNYSCVEGWTSAAGGTGNIGADPLFVRNPSDGGNGWGDDPATTEVDEGVNDDYGNLRLRPNSPCIDAASDAAMPADAADLDADGNTTERVPLDLAYASRFLDEPTVADTGVPVPPEYTSIADMGTYEYFADCNHNGSPDANDIAVATSQDCNSDSIPDECNVEMFDDASAWTTYDPGINGVGVDPDGYYGAVFDGRYVYFVPDHNGTERHGEVLRFDTQGVFSDASSWATYDPGANGVGVDPDGYAYAAFDGRYVYFAPLDNGSGRHGEVLRFDSQGVFSDVSSWVTYDPGANGVGVDPDGYIGAVFDGRYVYFVPIDNGSERHGEVLRFDSQGVFSDVSSWVTYDPGAHGVGVDPDGYAGAVFDGQYIYFAPNHNGTDRHGEVLRFDTQGVFSDASSWATYDPGANGVGVDTDGYNGTVFDGKYIYFVPYHNGITYHSEVLRYDTAGGFADASSWMTYDAKAAGTGTNPTGYVGAVFDGRFVYFVPLENDSGLHGEVLRYDTAHAFDDPSSWNAFDPGDNGVGVDPDGYYGAVFDGTYIYFAPAGNATGFHGEVLRYNAQASRSADRNENLVPDECEPDCNANDMPDDWDLDPADPDGDGQVSQDCNDNRIPDECDVEMLDDVSAWTTYDPAANGVGTNPRGYNGLIYDGQRYIYFVPFRRGPGTEGVHGEVLRYDTTSGFSGVSSWAAYDAGANGVGVDPDGYIGAAFDGRYVYFAPAGNGTQQHGEVLRYDSSGSFGNAASWVTYNPGTHGVGSYAVGFAGAVFDGRYVYFVPYVTDTMYSGEVLRYDTQGIFDSTSSWATYDPSANGVGDDPTGFGDAVFDGRYIYFVPFINSHGAHGEVLRYDTTGSFTNSASWATYNPGATGVGNEPDGYVGGVYDGRYVYFAPRENRNSYHGEVLRYDTIGEFSDKLSWAAYDPGANGVGMDPDGYLRAAFDGRYVYFAPYYSGTEQHGEVLRYDTRGSFSSAASWDTFDPGDHGVGNDPDGFAGVVFAGGYLYFAPYFDGAQYSGEVLRYDTQASHAADCNENGVPDECEPDTDGDGVINDCDDCPNTIPGIAVDTTGCPPVVPCDRDRDGDVDQVDWDTFELCASGAGVLQDSQSCGWAKLDGDGDVDQVDFAIFQRCYSGENVPANPNCAN